MVFGEIHGRTQNSMIAKGCCRRIPLTWHVFACLMFRHKYAQSWQVRRQHPTRGFVTWDHANTRQRADTMLRLRHLAEDSCPH